MKKKANVIEENRKKSTLRKILEAAGKLLLIFFAAGILALAFLRLSPYRDLEEFSRRPLSTKIFDRHGELLQVLALENGLRREFVPLEKMPALLPEIFLAAEDRRFYLHRGVDFGAVLRAAVQNVKERRTVSGASTITMQLARIISPLPRRTARAKLLEAANALRLEARFSKKEILEMYLNSVPFGFNAEGVASASRAFFGRSVETLSAEQIFCLAVIPRRPAQYNPLENPEACASAALDLHLAFSEDGSPRMSLKKFLAAAKNARPFRYPFELPHYIRHLAGQGMGLYQKPEVTLAAILGLQKETEKLLAQGLWQHSGNRLTNGAVLIADTQTGEILAWAGSGDFFDSRHNGQIDGVLAELQPGSSMKPFLYALALEHGFLPSSILPDVPLEFGFDELYVPQNFNNRYNGPVRLRVALASSLNVPAVFLLNELGLASYRDTLSKLQFRSLDKKNTGLSLALGGGEVSLYELVQAFSVFARDGKFLPLSATKRAKAEAAAAESTVFTKDTARLICDILADKNARATGFGYAQTFETSFPAMFKTGTANQFQNITALGATPRYTVGVWLGNFSGETVVGQTGSSVPASIAQKLLVALHGRAATDFKKPTQYERQKICALSGLPAGQFCGGTLLEYVPALRAESDSAPVRQDSDIIKSGNTCTWHTKNGVVYPALYEKWFLLKNRTGSLGAVAAALQIVSPRSGSVFFYDASLPPERQNMRVEALGGTEDIATVIVDGDTGSAFEVARPFSFQVPLSRGSHRLDLSCGGESASLQYTVR